MPQLSDEKLIEIIGKNARLFFQVHQGLSFALKAQYKIEIEEARSIYLAELFDMKLIYNIFDKKIPSSLVKRLVYDTRFEEYKQEALTNRREDLSGRGYPITITNTYRRSTRRNRRAFNSIWRQ